jgi:hypothetical protein
MKIIGIFIILASMSNPSGGYKYACKDTSGRTYHIMLLEKKNVGDTLKFVEETESCLNTK